MGREKQSISPESALRIAICNQQEGVSRVLKAANSTSDGINILKQLLLTPEVANIPISESIHEYFNVELQPTSKMTEGYHTNVARLLRNQLFEEDDPEAAAWLEGLNSRSGPKDPKSIINESDPRFDRIIAFILSIRLEGESYQQIQKLVEAEFGLQYESEHSLRGFVRNNYDLFPGLLEQEYQLKQKVMLRSQAASARARMHLFAGEPEEIQHQVRFIEALRVGQRLSWEEINNEIGENLVAPAYTSAKHLRKVVRKNISLFSRLTLELDTEIQCDELAQKSIEVSIKLRALSPEAEYELHQDWLKVKNNQSMKAFANERSVILGVSHNTVRRIISRLDKLHQES